MAHSCQRSFLFSLSFYFQIIPQAQCIRTRRPENIESVNAVHSANRTVTETGESYRYSTGMAAETVFSETSPRQYPTISPPPCSSPISTDHFLIYACSASARLPFVNAGPVDRLSASKEHTGACFRARNTMGPASSSPRARRRL